MKMEIHFAQVMARSEELFKQKLRARKIVNRLTREKSRLLDTLAALESEHIKSKGDSIENVKASNGSNSSSKPHSIFPDKADIFTDERIWNDDVKFLAQMQSESFEFSSDEEADPVPRNPMSLIEWLRRNQPSVFTIDSGSSTGADGKNGAETAPAAAASVAGAGGAAGSKKRKANGTEAGAAGAGSKSSRKRKAHVPASSAPAPTESQKTAPTENGAAEGAEAAAATEDALARNAPSDTINGNLPSFKQEEKLEE